MSLSQELAVPCLTTAHQGPLFPVEEVILDNFASKLLNIFSIF